MTELDKLQKIANSQKRELAKIDGRMEGYLENLSEEGWDKVDIASSDMLILGKKIARMKKTFESKFNQFKKKNSKELEKYNV